MVPVRAYREEVVGVKMNILAKSRRQVEAYNGLRRTKLWRVLGLL